MTYPEEKPQDEALRSYLVGPTRIENAQPCDFRLARRQNGELVLQAAYFWVCGTEHGWEWRTRETVNIAE